ncbi:MAG TPA: hypothetical protein VIV11_09755 [Kofleriaceae bacterium]
MFRDDHEAALARLEAVEAELAKEKSKDVRQEQRLASLEAELRAAKSKLRETEAELAKHRPPLPEPVALPKPASTAARPTSAEDAQLARRRAMLAFGLLAAAFVVGLSIYATKAGREDSEYNTSTTEETKPQQKLALPDSISALLPEIRARGEQELPGSRLIELSGKGITSEGALHETYGELEATFYRTVEPVEPEVDPKLPVGAAPPVAHSSLDRHKCAYVRRTATGWQEHSLAAFQMCVLGDLYEGRSALEPSCTMKTIWQRAIADGAPANAIAEISLQQSRWEFEINDQRLQFARTYSDDCR